MKRQFSLRQMLEVITVAAIALAIGKFADIYGSRLERPEAAAPWSVIVLVGGFGGAFLGVRWFAHDDLADCGFKSLVTGTVLTAIALLPLYLNSLVFAIRPQWLLQWDPLGELKVGVVVIAVGGIVASLLSLPTAAFLKLSRR